MPHDIETTAPQIPPPPTPRKRGRPRAANLLAPVETEVVKALAEGKTVAAIAKERGRSFKTVDAQKTSAMKKLDIHNRAALTLWAVHAGLVK